MGKSATGKDTIYERLLKDEELNLKRIIPYTTRPIRDHEEVGREYHFVTEADVTKLQEKGLIVEMREYLTVYGPWKYFTVNDGNIKLNEEADIYTFDFEFIDLTFSDSQEYSTFAYTSPKTNMGSDTSVEDPDPGFTPNPDAPGDIYDDVIDHIDKDSIPLFDSLFDNISDWFGTLAGNLSNFAGEQAGISFVAFMESLSPFLAVLFILILLFLIVWFFKSARETNIIHELFGLAKSGSYGRDQSYLPQRSSNASNINRSSHRTGKNSPKRKKAYNGSSKMRNRSSRK